MPEVNIKMELAEARRDAASRAELRRSEPARPPPESGVGNDRNHAPTAATGNQSGRACGAVPCGLTWFRWCPALSVPGFLMPPLAAGFRPTADRLARKITPQKGNGTAFEVPHAFL